MPKGNVVFGDSIAVIRENGETDAVESWTHTVTFGDPIDPAPHGLMLESNNEAVESIDGGLFKVISSGEILTPIN